MGQAYSGLHKTAAGKRELLIIPFSSPATQSQFHDGSSISVVKAKNSQPLRKASSGNGLVYSKSYLIYGGVVVGGLF